MGRPAILPLPDHQARLILAGVEQINLVAGGSDNRPFLQEFIKLVHGVTGEVYGAPTYRQLLRQFAPGRNPSLTTVHSEIRAYRSRARAQDAERPQERNQDTSAPALPNSLQDSVSASGRGISVANTLEKQDELLKLQALEVNHLRGRLAEMERQVHVADVARNAAERDAAELRVELSASREFATKQQETIRGLTEALETANARAAAEHRHNLQRVDAIRQEVRQAQERLQSAEQRIAMRESELKNAHALADGLRRQLSQLRTQVQSSPGTAPGGPNNE